MSKLSIKMNSICSWLSWKRVIELTFAILIVRWVFSLFANVDPAHASGYGLLFYLFGLACGIGFTLSTGRRATDCGTRFARFKKLLKQAYHGPV